MKGTPNVAESNQNKATAAKITPGRQQCPMRRGRVTTNPRECAAERVQVEGGGKRGAWEQIEAAARVVLRWPFPKEGKLPRDGQFLSEECRAPNSESV